jgi:hypothetical protein
MTFLEARFHTLAVAAALLLTCASPQAIAADQADGVSGNDSSVPKGLRWTDVEPAKRAEILELLAVQSKGNYEKIKTWKASYSYRTRNYFSEQYVSEVFVGQYAPSEKTKGLIQECDVLAKAAIDMGSSSIFRERETKRLRFFNPATNREVKVADVGGPEGRSVITVDKYIDFNPKNTITASVNFPDHPEAQNKRAAYVRPAEEGKRLGYADLLDFRHFYKLDPGSFSWQSIDLVVRALKGLLDPNQKREAETRLTVSQADGPDGGRWYRYRMNHSGPGNTAILWATQIWSSQAGFNPVSNVLAHDTPDGKPDFKTEWQWKAIDGIYVPSRIKEAVYHEPNNGISFERESKLEECVFNQPLDAHQFDYKGLGMRDGDIILNDMEGAVYKIKDGEPDKLGNYGDHFHANPRASTTRFATLAVLGFANSILLIFLVTMLRKRLRAPAGGSPESLPELK